MSFTHLWIKCELLWSGMCVCSFDPDLSSFASSSWMTEWMNDPLPNMVWLLPFTYRTGLLTKVKLTGRTCEPLFLWYILFLLFLLRNNYNRDDNNPEIFPLIPFSKTEVANLRLEHLSMDFSIFIIGFFIITL